MKFGNLLTSSTIDGSLVSVTELSLRHGNVCQKRGVSSLRLRYSLRRRPVNSRSCSRKSHRSVSTPCFSNYHASRTSSSVTPVQIHSSRLLFHTGALPSPIHSATFISFCFGRSTCGAATRTLVGVQDLVPPFDKCTSAQSEFELVITRYFILGKDSDVTQDLSDFRELRGATSASVRVEGKWSREKMNFINRSRR